MSAQREENLAGRLWIQFGWQSAGRPLRVVCKVVDELRLSRNEGWSSLGISVGDESETHSLHRNFSVEPPLLIDAWRRPTQRNLTIF